MEYSPTDQSPASNNKTLWIILGSLIGVLVLVMSGCVACGALVGLSALSNEGSTSKSNSKGSGGWGVGGGVGSTTWNGRLTCDDNSEDDLVFKFASNGNPIYLYQSSGGSREEELTGPGQNFRFPAAGGGVTYVNVESLETSSEGVNYTVKVSHERASGGTMIQSRRLISYNANRSGSKLIVVISIRSNSAASQPGFVIPDESVTECHAELSQAR